MKSYLTVAAVLGCLTSPALAAHANPWASESATVLSKNHDANQARSVNTPGEDEMRGAMARNARGKLGDPPKPARAAKTAATTDRDHGSGIRSELSP